MTYPEPSELDGIDTLILTVDDGTVFRCAPVVFGGPNAPYPPGLRLRWAIDRLTPRVRDEENPVRSFIGPPIMPDRSPQAVQRLIAEWWEMKKGISAEQDTASSLRRRLVADDTEP